MEESFILLLFSLLCVVQIAFLTLFLIGFLKKKPVQTNLAIPVSVVVCAHNEEQNLKILVPQLLDQDYPEFEVVVVNDRSSDGTLEYLTGVSLKEPRLRVINVDHVPDHVNGKKFGLTIGIKGARYETILFTDADCVPKSKNWVKSMAAGFSPGIEIVLGYSPYLKSRGFLNSFIRYETLFTAMQYLGFALLKFPYMGVGRNLGYKKSLFLSNKGFYKHLNVNGGDDDLFINQHARKDNTAVVMGADSLMFSIPHHEFSSFFKQKIRHLKVGVLYKFKHKLLLGIFMGTQLSLWPMLFWTSQMSIFGWTGGIFAVKTLFLIFCIKIIVKALGDRFEYGWVPFLDFLFFIYYISTALKSIVTKKATWRT